MIKTGIPTGRSCSYAIPRSYAIAYSYAFACSYAFASSYAFARSYAITPILPQLSKCFVESTINHIAKVRFRKKNCFNTGSGKTFLIIEKYSNC